MSLLDDMKGQYSEMGKEMSKTPIAAPTHIQLFDHINGGIMETVNGQRFLNKGIAPRIYTFVSKPGVGKSALAIAAACRMVSGFSNGTVFYEDPEGNTHDMRIMTVGGLPPSEYTNKVYKRDIGITFQSIFERIKQIGLLKEANSKKYLLPVKNTMGQIILDNYGKPMMMYPPTPIVIDSLPMVGLDKIDDSDELKRAMKGNVKLDTQKVATNTAGMQRTNQTAQWIDHIKDWVFKYNIPVIIINHIGKNIHMGFGNAPKQLPWLTQDEKLTGGNKYLHMCYGIYKLTPGTKITDEYGPMISGSTNYIQTIKNKTNEAGAKYGMVFNQSTGYNNILTNLQYLIDTNYGGSFNSPRSMSFDLVPEITFTRKNFYEKVQNEIKTSITSGGQRPLYDSLIYTASRAMYHDFILKIPDPYANNLGAVCNAKPITGSSLNESQVDELKKQLGMVA